MPGTTVSTEPVKDYNAPRSSDLACNYDDLLIIRSKSIARQVLRKTIACLFYHFDIALWDAQKDISQKYRYMATFPQKGKDGTLQLSLTSRVRSMP